MVKVLIVQVDNRLDLDYLCLTKRTNIEKQEYLYYSKHTNYIHYTYLFLYMIKKYYENIHPATAKIQIMADLISERKYDIIVFLDSDAWIQNPDHLHQLIEKLSAAPNIQGCFSRDPYLMVNTYINSGSFIIKVNDYTENMYREILEFLKREPSHTHKWPYDQYYISNTIFNRKQDFWIFIPHILNTPNGIILRHSWWKNQKMFSDLYKILDHSIPYTKPEPIDFDQYIDNQEFPNKDDSGEQYR
jgi:hypothetical protein